MGQIEDCGYTIAELRCLIQEGIDSGPGRFRSIDEIKAEARRRLEEQFRTSACGASGELN